MSNSKPSSSRKGPSLSLRTSSSIAIVGAGLVLAAVFLFTSTSTTNNALDFDGVDDQLQLVELNPAGTSFTKEAWVYATATNCNHIVTSRYASFWFYNGYLRAGNNNNHYVVRDNTVFPVNTWVHVAVTYDAATSTMVLYRNGVAVDTEPLSPVNAGGTLLIGNHPTTTCYFAGQMDEVRVWNYARSQAEIQSVMSTELNPPVAGMVGYYPFNDGVADGNNTSLSQTADESGAGNHATFSGFARSGTSSNFVNSTAGIITPPLPVEWLDFTATETEGKVVLDWATAAELNNTGFEVQRQEGPVWQKLSFVDSKGSGSQVQRYQYEDLNPKPGENYYRLMQVDQDGGFSYSRLRTIFIGEGSATLTLYPNPTQDVLKVEVGNTAEKATLQVYDLQGSLLLHEVKGSGSGWEINVSLLLPGTYILRAATGKEVLTGRFVKSQ